MGSFSKGPTESIGNWTRSHRCYIPGKNLFTSGQCPKILGDPEFKDDELINLAEGS